MLEQVKQQLELDDIYFWATHSGAELDMFAIKARCILAVQLSKATD